MVAIITGLLKTFVRLYALVKGDRFRYPIVHEGSVKYMTFEEKMWWGYKFFIKQIENAEKGKDIERYFSEQDLDFAPGAGFKEKSSLILTAGGDMLASPEDIYQSNTQHMWDDVKDFYLDGDIVYANLEMPFDPYSEVGTVPKSILKAPKLNGTPELFDVFINKGEGVSFFSTANNHSLDRGESGLLGTLDFLDAKGYPHVGTARSVEEQDDIPIVERNGIKVAFLSYTFGLNESEVPPGKDYLVNLVRLNNPDTSLDLIERHVRIARQKGADIIAACLHWSLEFESYPIENVIKMGHRVVDLGIDIIIGNHSHVIQPIERYEFKDPHSGTVKPGFIVYAMGDMTSTPKYIKNSWLSTLIRLKISKGDQDGMEVTRVTDLKVKPIYRYARKKEEKIEDFRLLDFAKLMEGLRAGENTFGFSGQEINELKRLEALLNKILPREHKRVLG